MRFLGLQQQEEEGAGAEEEEKAEEEEERRGEKRRKKRRRNGIVWKPNSMVTSPSLYQMRSLAQYLSPPVSILEIYGGSQNQFQVSKRLSGAFCGPAWLVKICRPTLDG